MNLSVKDAARLLNVSDKTIYRWIKQELIPAYRVSGQHRFNQSELLEWATSRRMGVSPRAYHEPETELMNTKRLGRVHIHSRKPVWLPYAEDDGALR